MLAEVVLIQSSQKDQSKTACGRSQRLKSSAPDSAPLFSRNTLIRIC